MRPSAKRLCPYDRGTSRGPWLTGWNAASRHDPRRSPRQSWPDYDTCWKEGYDAYGRLMHGLFAATTDADLAPCPSTELTCPRPPA